MSKLCRCAVGKSAVRGLSTAGNPRLWWNSEPTHHNRGSPPPSTHPEPNQDPDHKESEHGQNDEAPAVTTVTRLVSTRSSTASSTWRTCSTAAAGAYGPAFRVRAMCSATKTQPFAPQSCTLGPP
jgi:hypothetical protein